MDLREFRKALDLTIEAASMAAGVAPTTWWRIETRDRQVPLANHVEKIRLWVAHQRKVKKLPKGWDVDWSYLAAQESPPKKSAGRKRR